MDYIDGFGAGSNQSLQQREGPMALHPWTFATRKTCHAHP
jgi:hypothetical protein